MSLSLLIIKGPHLCRKIKFAVIVSREIATIKMWNHVPSDMSHWIHSGGILAMFGCTYILPLGSKWPQSVDETTKNEYQTKAVTSHFCKACEHNCSVMYLPSYSSDCCGSYLWTILSSFMPRCTPFSPTLRYWEDGMDTRANNLHVY